MNDQELLTAARHLLALATDQPSDAPPAEVAATLAACIDRLGYGGLLARRAIVEGWDPGEVETVPVSVLVGDDLVLDANGMVWVFGAVIAPEAIAVVSEGGAHQRVIHGRSVRRLTEMGRVRHSLGCAPEAA